MKVFEGGEPRAWRGKVNFVDKNNVVVGFDDQQGCCEQFGWFLNRTKPTTDMLVGDLDDKELEGYVFDPDFCEEPESPKNHDEGGMVVFRLVLEDGSQEAFLALYNHHNGYYSHGFSMMVGDVQKQQGYL